MYQECHLKSIILEQNKFLATTLAVPFTAHQWYPEGATYSPTAVGVDIKKALRLSKALI
jgi:hypothetical protein